MRFARVGEVDPVELAGFEGGLAERFVPELMRGEVIEAHHLCRYLWASALVPGKRVLDAGCGVAYGSEMMAEAGADSVVGVDVAESVVEASRSRVSESVTLQCADLRSLPCDDGSFDVAVCFEVIEHVDDPERVIGELRRVLTSDGLLIASSPNRAVSTGTNPHHRRELLPEELEALMAERFGHVRLFRQASWLASAIFDDDAFASTGAVAIQRPEVLKLAAAKLGEERLTIAIATDAALPPVASGMTVTASSALERWRDKARHHHSVARRRGEEVAKLRARIAELEDAGESPSGSPDPPTEMIRSGLRGLVGRRGRALLGKAAGARRALDRRWRPGRRGDEPSAGA